MKFDLLNTDGHARRGRLTFARGVIETPIFMPVGTHWAENRGVNDVFIVCIDGLSGFPDAITAALQNAGSALYRPYGAQFVNVCQLERPQSRRGWIKSDLSIRDRYWSGARTRSLIAAQTN